MKKIVPVIIMILLTVSMFSQTRNPDKPLKGKWDFQMKKMWEVEMAGNEPFGIIQNIRSADDGRVYILDAKHFKIHIFSKVGKHISSFGKKGEGPGEIRTTRMGTHIHMLKNTLIYVDQNRIHYFSLDGTYGKTVSIPAQLRPRAFVSEVEFISAPTMIRDPRQKTAKIKLYNIKDKSEKVISEFQPFEKAYDTQEDGGRQITVGIIVEDITPMVFVGARNRKVYYGKSDSYKINVVDLKGTENIGFSVEGRERKPVSAAFKKNLTLGLGDIPQDMVKRIIDGLPDKASFFQGFSIDKNGMIYVLVSDPDSESLLTIDIFSPKGTYLYNAELKIEENLSIQTTYLKDNLLLFVVEDEDGNQKAVKYLLNLPKF